ncbi:NUDIX domain-containing protein [uncultured Paraglaciecola sp.]|uniref:NUDIX hydrolase n=1 Tax=uncultured Paraglaciecola sp. TaxID=1765024 RepID=UPI0030DC950F
MFCVKCAQPSLVKQGEKAYRCNLCDFVYFHNVAAAVCGVIVCQGQMLLVERAQQPCKGKLDFPGGFVDYNESNEQALKRELFEELQLTINVMQYLFSFPNQYLYKDVLYSTLDNFFEITLHTKPALTLQQEEVSRYLWLDLESVETKELAFASGQAALAEYLIKTGQ